MATTSQQSFESLCSAFDDLVPSLGVFPWDPLRAVARYRGASRGEKLILSFLLGVWNPTTKWKGVARFDLLDAGHCLSLEALGVIARWTAHPRYP